LPEHTEINKLPVQSEVAAQRLEASAHKPEALAYLREASAHKPEVSA
jgi:hypothetical protein